MTSPLLVVEKRWVIGGVYPPLAGLDPAYLLSTYLRMS